jgi:hypothetical protein
MKRSQRKKQRQQWLDDLEAFLCQSNGVLPRERAEEEASLGVWCRKNRHAPDVLFILAPYGHAGKTLPAPTFQQRLLHLGSHLDSNLGVPPRTGGSFTTAERRLGWWYRRHLSKPDVSAVISHHAEAAAVQRHTALAVTPVPPKLPPPPTYADQAVATKMGPYGNRGFAAKLERLKTFVGRQGRMPRRSQSDREEEQSAQWMLRMRVLLANDRLLPSEAILLMSHFPSLGGNDWRRFLGRGFPLPASSRLDSDGKPYPSNPEDTIEGYVWECLGVTHVPLRQCHSGSRPGTVERILYFLNSPVYRRGLMVPPAPLASWPSRRGTHGLKSSYVCKAQLGAEVAVRAGLCSARHRPILAALRAAATKEEAVSIFCHEKSVLDNSHIGKEGRYFKNVAPLLETTHPLPRRASKSVTIGEPIFEQQRGWVRSLFAYGRGAQGRPDCDTRCEAMGEDYAALGEVLWKRCHRYLSAVSRTCPPNGLQVLHYSSRLHARMRRHKDRHFKGGSQIAGSSVMAFTIGDPMEFGYATCADPTGHGGTGFDEGMSVLLEEGSVNITHSHDDERLFHGTLFPPSHNGKWGRARTVFVYRWLGDVQVFRCDDADTGPRRFAMVDEGEAQALSKRSIGQKWEAAFGPDEAGPTGPGPPVNTTGSQRRKRMVTNARFNKSVKDYKNRQTTL